MGSTEPGAGLGWMKSFPPGQRDVLLPVGDRAAAAVGVTMYAASRPRIVLVQRLAARAVRVAGARIVPGGRTWVPFPYDDETWVDLVREWAQTLGPIHSVALYRRREAARAGLTLTAVRDGRALGLVKVRSEPEGLTREQAALGAAEASSPSSFRTPRALGSGSVGDVHWSIQSAVFRRPHHPVFSPPAGLFEEIAEVAAAVVEPGDGEPAHGDVAPWNLRRDHLGQVWLYDWEDVARLPPEADRTYLTVGAYVLAGTPIPSGLPRTAIEHWREVWRSRKQWESDGDPLHTRMLEALDLADLQSV